MACVGFDPLCWAGSAASAAAGSAIENLANAVNEMVGQAMASLGTIWVYVGTPQLTASGSQGSPIQPGESAGGEQIATILNYVTWVGLAVAALSLVWLGVLIAASLRRGEGGTHVGRLGLVLGGVALVGAAGSLIAGLLPAGPHGAAGATLFLQSALWWYMGALAVASVIVAGVRMAWEQRSDPGKDLLRSLFTLIVVAGAGVTITQMALTASDRFSVWLLQGSISCDVSTDTACFGENLTRLWNMTDQAGSSGLAVMVAIVLGLFAALTSFLQILVMLARAGIVVILAGVLPLSAAATNTEMGKQWFRKTLTWLIAWVLYKPAAAIVYATAFQLAGSDIYADDDAIVAVLTGLMLMLLALVALPVLLRLVTPAVGAVAGGGGLGGAATGAAMAALPMGAVAAASRMGGGQSSAGGGGAPPPPGPTSSDPADGATTGSGGGSTVDLRDGSGGASGGMKVPAGVGGGGATQAGGGGAVAGGGGAAAGAGAVGAAGPAAPVVAGAQAAKQAGTAAKEFGGQLGGAAAGNPSGADAGSLGGSSPDRGANPSGAGSGSSAQGGGNPSERSQGASTPSGAGPTGGVSAGGGGTPTPSGSGSGAVSGAGGAAGGGIGGAARSVADGAAAAARNVMDQAPQAVAGDSEEDGPSGSR